MTLEKLEAAALNLPIQERIRLAQELWDSILPKAEAEPDLLPLMEEQIREIERRLADHERDPSSAIPWAEARARLRSRLG